MFGFFKTLKASRAAQRGLTEAFKARGRNFMTMEATVHKALVKETMATSVEAAMEHLDRIEMLSFGRVSDIVEHYRERSKSFDPARQRRRVG
jgi:hypothetical protein